MNIVRGLNQRARRYKLSDNDDTKFQYVRASSTHSMRVAHLVDLSKSGALLKVDSENVPLKNETLLFEFKVPGIPETVVWKGKVARLVHEEKDILAGIHFDEMPEVFSSSLERGLRRQFEIAQEEQEKQVTYSSKKVKTSSREYLMGGLLGLLVAAALFFMLINPYTPQPASEMKNMSIYNPDAYEIREYQSLRVKTMKERLHEIKRDIANDGKNQ